jgi:hypothetical protein
MGDGMHNPFAYPVGTLWNEFRHLQANVVQLQGLMEAACGVLLAQEMPEEEGHLVAYA